MSTTVQPMPTTEHTQVSTAEIVVNTTTPLGWVDIAAVALIVGAALYYLYRNLLPKRGQCAACASQGKAGGCQSTRMAGTTVARTSRRSSPSSTTRTWNPESNENN